MLLIYYFLIGFAQTKITLFIFSNKKLIKNSSFLEVEPASRVMLRNRSMFVQTLHQMSRFIMIQYLSFFCEFSQLFSNYGGSNPWGKTGEWSI